MRLLFVCTGNTCRSPMAEGIARRLIDERQLEGFEVGSAGTSAWPDAPASDGSLLVAMEQGMDLGSHRARTLSPELVQWADRIFVMGPHHLDRAEALGGSGKSYLLSTYASNGASDQPVSDPFGGELDVYRQTFVELSEAIGRALDRAVAERARPAT